MNELFTEFLDDSQIKNIRETFQAIDVDDSGTIELKELRSAYSSLITNEEVVLDLKSMLSVDEIEEILIKID